MKTLKSLLTAALITLINGGICGQIIEPTLKVGDPAPKLQVAKWAQGEPVADFKPGTTYIVEFWATWCGPCRTSIPHLNELHMKFKDKGLVVIGQDVWENDEAQVPKFIKQMGDKMTYRVALDDKSQIEKGAMAVNWMQAAGQNGIPSSFVVNKEGKIAWIGHPMTLKEEVIEQVLAGTFDIKEAAREYSIKQHEVAERKKRAAKLDQLTDELVVLLNDSKHEAALAIINMIEELVPQEQRAKVANLRTETTLTRDFEAAIKAKQWKAAGKILDQLESQDFKNKIWRVGHTDVRCLRVGLLMAQDKPKGLQLARELSDANQDHVELQNSIAWGIAKMEGVEARDLELAELIAVRANTAAKGKDADILDTLAHVHSLRGDKEKAVAVQEQAVSVASKGEKPNYQFTLFKLLVDKRDYPAAYTLARQASDANPDNPKIQNSLAWAIATMKELEKRDLELAELLATRANTAAKEQDANIVDTVARVCFLKGQKEKALALQQKAIDMAKGKTKEKYQATLDSYKAGKMPDTE